MVLNSENRVDLARLLGTAQQVNGDQKEPKDQQDLAAAAKEFESLFMHMMLKSMRQANRTMSDGNYFNSFETRMYEDMLDEKLSISLSHSHTLGIADLLVNQLSASPRRQDYELPMGASNVPTNVPLRQSVFQKPEDFVSAILPKAESVAADLGIRPEFVVAQAALETGWGQHMIFDADGRNSFNLFGIKANADWQGKTVAIESLEMRSGIAQQERSKFKVYGGYDEALADYAKLLSENPRYDAVRAAEDVESFGQTLVEGGYATDPDYAVKLARIVKYPVLNQDRYAMEVR